MDIDKEYAMILDRTSKLEERRAGITNTYLTVNTLISTVIAFLVKDSHLGGVAAKISVAAFLTAGILTTVFWRAVLAQLSRLVGYWYGKARALEDEMPKSHKLISDEHADLYVASEEQPHPILLSEYERHLTWIFTYIYVGFLIGGALTILHH